jgi:hypothetical protein
VSEGSIRPLREDTKAHGSRHTKYLNRSAALISRRFGSGNECDRDVVRGLEPKRWESDTERSTGEADVTE